jgi:pimeloyl-ACP methyl ester carboxylesterase
VSQANQTIVYYKRHNPTCKPPATQATMLGMLLDNLHIDTVDLVANDSGGAVAQLFLAKCPGRVRTLLLTNWDVDENSPPPQFLPFIEQAEQGAFVDQFILPQLNDKKLARSSKGMGGLAYTYPRRLADATIETYFRPVVATPLKKAQMNQVVASMETNPLVAIRKELHRWQGPARMVWGLRDASTLLAPGTSSRLSNRRIKDIPTHGVEYLLTRFVRVHDFDVRAALS